jgi:hypothetical protein
MRAPGDHQKNDLHAPQPARLAPLDPLRHTMSQKAATTSTKPYSSESSRKPCERLESSSVQDATRFAIPLLRICSKLATISEPSKNSWATRMSRLP